MTQLKGQDTDSEGGLKDEPDPKAGANESDRTENLSRHHGNDEKVRWGGHGTAESGLFVW